MDLDIVHVFGTSWMCNVLGYLEVAIFLAMSRVGVCILELFGCRLRLPTENAKNKHMGLYIALPQGTPTYLATYPSTLPYLAQLSGNFFVIMLFRCNGWFFAASSNISKPILTRGQHLLWSSSKFGPKVVDEKELVGWMMVYGIWIASRAICRPILGVVSALSSLRRRHRRGRWRAHLNAKDRQIPEDV